MVNSMYKVQLPVYGWAPGDEEFDISTSLRWAKCLYEYFINQGHNPIILDAEDVIYNTKAITDKLCDFLGIDSDGVKETWDPLPREQWPDHSIGNALTGHLMGSSGVERAKEVSL